MHKIQVDAVRDNIFRVRRSLVEEMQDVSLVVKDSRCQCDVKETENSLKTASYRLCVEAGKVVISKMAVRKIYREKAVFMKEMD